MEKLPPQKDKPPTEYTAEREYIKLCEKLKENIKQKEKQQRDDYLCK